MQVRFIHVHIKFADKVGKICTVILRLKITSVDIALAGNNVHPWSHSYEDIRTIVDMLNDKVEVVSVSPLLTMIFTSQLLPL